MRFAKPEHEKPYRSYDQRRHGERVNLDDGAEINDGEPKVQPNKVDRGEADFKEMRSNRVHGLKVKFFREFAIKMRIHYEAVV